jgi:hypothetical protein
MLKTGCQRPRDQRRPQRIEWDLATLSDDALVFVPDADREVTLTPAADHGLGAQR